MRQSLGFNIAEAAAEVFNSKSAEIGYPADGFLIRRRHSVAANVLDDDVGMLAE